MAQLRKWFSVKGIADYCLVSRVTVRRWIVQQKMSATRLPSGHYRIRIEDFRAFLERFNIPVRKELLESELERKEVRKNGSADIDGPFRAGRGTGPDPGQGTGA